MGTESLSDPVRVLTDYSQKRVGANEVMRALAGHKGWLAPALMFARAEGENLFLDRMVMVANYGSSPNRVEVCKASYKYQ